MSSMSQMAPLVIVGPTASGKSELGLKMAESAPPAEIISADAMAIYEEMNIGTAKVSLSERRKIPHHLVDVASVTENYTVSQFQAEAFSVIRRLQQNSINQIIVGGTGLYVRSVVDEFTMPPNFPDIRQELELEPDADVLWQRLNELDASAASKMEPTNKRRIVRALEVCIGSGQKFSSFGPGVNHYEKTSHVQIGLEIDRTVLDERIEKRFDFQVENGFVDEVQNLMKLELASTAMQALGYKEIMKHLKGEYSLEDAINESKLRTKRFARRQQRWFRRDPRITWFQAMDPDLSEKVWIHWQDNSK